MSIKQELHASALPEDIQKLIRRVVRRTRLRHREQQDVARELMTHFEDALESGDSVSDAINTYGSEKTAAKLLRNACLRKRWWVEIVFVKSMKYASAVFGCLLVVYFTMALFAMNRKTNIAVDYVAKMNETAAAISKSERAWPLYRAAGIALHNNSEPTPKVDGLFVNPTWAGDTGWDAYAVWLSTHMETVNLIHQGTAKEGMGFIVNSRVAEEDKELWPEQYEKLKEQKSSFMLAAHYPQLRELRRMARLLRFDAIAAAASGDGDRSLKDIESLIRLGTHCREHATLINDLVSMSIYNLAFDTLGRILERAPHTLTNTQFNQIQTVIASLDEEFGIRFEGERMFFLDVLQRMYTDDGNGDGVIVPRKMLEAFHAFDVESVNGLESSSSATSILLAPIADVFGASRKEVLERYDEYTAMYKEYQGVPLYAWGEKVAQHDHFESKKGNPFSLFNPYLLTALLTPVFDRAILNGLYTAARRDGMVAVMYAIERHRATGQWPLDLAPCGVVDPWNEQPWRITLIDNQPVIYSVGNDGDDDGGRHHDEAREWHANPDITPDGDWVLWPSQE